jgi:hypothetical protein
MTSDPDVKALVSAITGTSKKLDDTQIIYNHITLSIRKMRLVLRVALIGIFLDMTLSLAFAYILHNQTELNDRVQANQDSIHRAECDLNTVLIAANTPEQRAKSPNPELYDSWYVTIYESRVQLGCQPPLINPRYR